MQHIEGFYYLYIFLGITVLIGRPSGFLKVETDKQNIFKVDFHRKYPLFTRISIIPIMTDSYIDFKQECHRDITPISYTNLEAENHLLALSNSKPKCRHNVFVVYARTRQLLLLLPS